MVQLVLWNVMIQLVLWDVMVLGRVVVVALQFAVVLQAMMLVRMRV